MRTADRDQSASQNAHAYYQALIQQHPTSPYAVLARSLAHARETLATHELDVADYYERYDRTHAVEIRILDLVNRYRKPTWPARHCSNSASFTRNRTIPIRRSWRTPP
jgi:outer membrane protein assembly factor BamD (BamD/ComL family)